MKMKEELIGPAAMLATSMLQKVEREHSEFNREIVGSAFEEAYFGLLEGIERVNKEIERRENPVKTRATSVAVKRKPPTKTATS